jgi:hypothetical protein
MKMELSMKWLGKVKTKLMQTDFLKFAAIGSRLYLIKATRKKYFTFRGF